LDNDGVEGFIAEHLPYLATIGCPTIVSIAGSSQEDFEWLARRLTGQPGVAALELNISCPNVSGGVDFGSCPTMCQQVVRGVRETTDLPILAKLTPNVTDIVAVARGAYEGGADGLTLINTLLGMAIDWRKRRPLLGNVMGGLSGPAIKPVALRCVHQVARAVPLPIVGVGGISSLNDAMEFVVAGATAVQIGTANFYNPTVSMQILDQLPAAVASLGAESVTRVVGSLRLPAGEPPSPGGPTDPLSDPTELKPGVKNRPS
jgi:dihydroorotate dehydrogenase (NAD+) catalytic subunit